MTPRSYEFSCKSCGKTVTESSESETCSNCSLNPAGPGASYSPAPPPVQKTPQNPVPAAGPAMPGAPKKGGFSVTIRSAPKCEFCGGKGTVGSQPCPRCGGKK